MFSTEFRNTIKETPNISAMEQIETLKAEHEARFHKRLVSQKDRPARLLGHNGTVLLLKLITRSLYLLRGFDLAINDANSTTCFLNVRAHWETTGALACFHKWLTKFYRDECTFEELDAKLVKLSLGGRVFPDKDHVGHTNIPDSINVMSLIDDLDSQWKTMGGEITKPFRGEYEFLSEFCHPNFLGNSIGSEMVESGCVEYHYPPILNESEISILLSDLAISLTFFTRFYDNCFSLLEKNEEMPMLHKL